jgi:hypothetical protein
MPTPNNLSDINIHQYNNHLGYRQCLARDHLLIDIARAVEKIAPSPECDAVEISLRLFINALDAE